jgi:hypothetical protein
MQDEVLKEIQDLKYFLSKLVGTDDLPSGFRFSEEALDKAKQLYHQMRNQSEEWVKEDDIGKYIKSAGWHAGPFIRKEFSFTNWTKKGYRYLYSKKDLIALNEELMARNIDLSRYRDYLDDKAAFEKRRMALKYPQKRNPKNKPFLMPDSKIKNITTSDIPKPDPEIVKADLSRLKEVFKTEKLALYVDIYKGTHAMLKHMYFLEKYLEPGLKRKCNKWCDDFNYANHALELITGRKEKFKVEDPAMIQL